VTEQDFIDEYLSSTPGVSAPSVDKRLDTLESFIRTTGFVGQEIKTGILGGVRAVTPPPGFVKLLLSKIVDAIYEPHRVGKVAETLEAFHFQDGVDKWWAMLDKNQWAVFEVSQHRLDRIVDESVVLTISPAFLLGSGSVTAHINPGPYPTQNVYRPVFSSTAAPPLTAYSATVKLQNVSHLRMDTALISDMLRKAIKQRQLLESSAGQVPSK
jgi:hypothetical protein